MAIAIAKCVCKKCGKVVEVTSWNFGYEKDAEQWKRNKEEEFYLCEECAEAREENFSVIEVEYKVYKRDYEYLERVDDSYNKEKKTIKLEYRGVTENGHLCKFPVEDYEFFLERAFDRAASSVFHGVKNDARWDKARDEVAAHKDEIIHDRFEEYVKAVDKFALFRSTDNITVAQGPVYEFLEKNIALFLCRMPELPDDGKGVPIWGVRKELEQEEEARKSREAEDAKKRAYFDGEKKAVRVNYLDYEEQYKKTYYKTVDDSFDAETYSVEVLLPPDEEYVPQYKTISVPYADYKARFRGVKIRNLKTTDDLDPDTMVSIVTRAGYEYKPVVYTPTRMPYKDYKNGFEKYFTDGYNERTRTIRVWLPEGVTYERAEKDKNYEQKAEFRGGYVNELHIEPDVIDADNLVVEIPDNLKAVSA